MSVAEYKSVMSDLGRKVTSNPKDARKIMKAISNPDFYKKGVKVTLENGKKIIVSSALNKKQ